MGEREGGRERETAKGSLRVSWRSQTKFKGGFEKKGDDLEKAEKYKLM